MSADETHFLNKIVEAVKEELGGNTNDYATVIITVLLGKEEVVLEAEATFSSGFDQDGLPCKSAVIKLSGWESKEIAE
jgi:hypothetical protein